MHVTYLAQFLVQINGYYYLLPQSSLGGHFKGWRWITALENELLQWGREQGWDREFGIHMYTLLYLKWITNKVLLYSSGNSAQWYGSLDGRGVGARMDTCICTTKSLCCPPETITHCLMAILQYKIKSLKHTKRNTIKDEDGFWNEIPLYFLEIREEMNDFPTRQCQTFLPVMQVLGKGSSEALGCRAGGSTNCSFPTANALGYRQIQGVRPKETAELEAPGCSFPTANGGAPRKTNING